MRRLSIELPEALHQQIKSRASLEGVSMRAYVLQRLGVLDAPSASTPASMPEPGSIQELLHNREWRGEQTRAEIDAGIAEERAAWPER